MYCCFRGFWSGSRIDQELCIQLELNRYTESGRIGKLRLKSCQRVKGPASSSHRSGKYPGNLDPMIINEEVIDTIAV